MPDEHVMTDRCCSHQIIWNAQYRTRLSDGSILRISEQIVSIALTTSRLQLHDSCIPKIIHGNSESLTLFFFNSLVFLPLVFIGKYVIKLTLIPFTLPIIFFLLLPEN